MHKLNKVLSLDRQAQQFIKAIVQKDETVVDATAGNGHDTLFLAKLVETNGAVYAFDIQDEALEHTRQKLSIEDCLQQVHLININHDQAAEFILGQTSKHVAAIMFNLGFLPGSDKAIYTKSTSTLNACTSLLPLLKVGGIMTIHAYTGIHNSKTEAEIMIAWAKNLIWKKYYVCLCSQLNKTKNIEHLVCIHRLS